MYDNILVPTDGSTETEQAVGHGLGHARTYGATVHALYVLDRNTYAFEDVPRSIVGLLNEGGNAALEEIDGMGRERGLDVETAFLGGRPSVNSSTTSTRTTWTSSRWARTAGRARSTSGVPPSA